MSLDVQRVIEDLRAEINRHSDLYYLADAPEISDLEFDQMLERLNGPHRAKSAGAQDERQEHDPADHRTQFHDLKEMRRIYEALSQDKRNKFQARILE